VSGIGAEREANYQAYLRFLNSAFLQLSAGAVHDYFNERGLVVINGAGTQMRVGGDDTLLSQSNAVGAQTAGRAAELSRQAIDETIRTGATAITAEQIWQLVPQHVIVMLPSGETRTFSLAEFQYAVIRPLCYTELFPQLVLGLKGGAVRSFGAEMVTGGISADTRTAPPPRMGVHPVLAGDRGMG
jgi:hypothetical protein